MKTNSFVKKLMALLCAFVVTAVTCVPALQAQAATANIHTTSGTGYANTAVYVRKDASITSAIVVTLDKKDTVKITGNKNGWIKVTATHKKKTYKGYMGAKYVTLTNTTKFNDVMKAVNDIQAGSAGTSLRCKTAASVLKKYAKTLSGTTKVSTFTTLATKWIKNNSANKSELKENIAELESYMDTTDVLYLQIINGITAAANVKTTSFNTLMKSIYAIKAGSAGTASRCKTAASVLKKYAKNVNGLPSAASFKKLATKWIKNKSAKKSQLKEDIEELDMYMDSTDVLYLRIINGIEAAC